MMLMLLRACRLVVIVCCVTAADALKRPMSPKEQRAKARKEMRETLGYVYQEGSLQAG